MDLANLAVVAPVLIAAVVLHEVAHGVVALWCGDPTAQERGRLTLNPLPHVDPVGTVVLPALLAVAGGPVFGWARPVPIDPRRMRRPKTDMAKVAVAGPAVNLLLAAVSAVVLKWLFGNGAELSGYLGQLALASVVINCILAAVNLLPILPLDGGRILVGLLPMRQAVAYARLEPYGLFVVIGLFATGAAGPVLGPVVDGMIRFFL